MNKKRELLKVSAAQKTHKEICIIGHDVWLSWPFQKRRENVENKSENLVEFRNNFARICSNHLTIKIVNLTRESMKV